MTNFEKNSKNQLSLILSLMTEEDCKMLKEIHEPTVVAIPPIDTRNALCVMPDGEIRSYGIGREKRFRDDRDIVYLASRDGGLSWKKHRVNGICSCAGTRISNGKYISLICGEGVVETGLSISRLNLEKGMYAILSDSPDSENFEIIPVAMGPYYCPYSPIELESGRIACTFHHEESDTHPVFAFSDDCGKTWSLRELECVPKHKIEFPHKGLRWQNTGNEPTVVQFEDGTLYMLIRTSLDYFYEAYSYDEGETWSKVAPSSFHGTLTSPRILRLSDNRILCCLCNSQPLPELNHEEQKPRMWDVEIDGSGEDVFTNRDVNHCAISSDSGKTWRGFREMALNSIRNDSDYRTKGHKFGSFDKSVHQFQMLELPFNKVLVSYGQNQIARKTVIFDIDWLYETQRHEDFRLGLSNVSTQVYLKSVSGNFRMAGHCSWNRTNGAVLMPDPEENFEEALFISRIHDPRLFSEVQGVIWNFPAAHKGTVSVRLRIDGEPVHISLCDRWLNPVDETIPFFSAATLELKKEVLKPSAYSVLNIEWDTKEGTVLFSVEGRIIDRQTVRGDIVHGISYLCIQSSFENEDTEGCYIKNLDMISGELS